VNKAWLLVPAFPGVAFFAVALTAEGLPSPSTLLLPGLVILLLICTNGFFVTAEFAINGVRPTQIEELAEKGHKTAARVLELLNSTVRQNRYIATAQLGITIASLGLGMYGEPKLSHFLEPYLARLLGTEPDAVLITTTGYIVSLSFLTYLHVVLGEMVPKTMSLNAARKAILLIAGPMHFIEKVLALPVFLLHQAGSWLLHVLRIPPGEEHFHSPEELEQIVTESAEEGLLNEKEEDLILNIFTFSERQAHQVMTPRRKIQAVPVDIALPDLIEVVSHSRFSRFPVYERNLDHILGILHLKDLIRMQLYGGEFNLRRLLRPAPTIPEHYPVEQLLNAFKRRRLHMAIVMDEFGGTAGIVTLEDLVEEIIGEVRDEFDKKEQDPLVELGPGSLEVSGQYLIDDLRDYVDLGDEESLPDVETVGGLIVAQLGRPPQVGDHFTFRRHIEFTVLAVDGLAVARARVDFPVPEKETSPSHNHS